VSCPNVNPVPTFDTVLQTTESLIYSAVIGSVSSRPGSTLAAVVQSLGIVAPGEVEAALEAGVRSKALVQVSANMTPCGCSLLSATEPAYDTTFWPVLGRLDAIAPPLIPTLPTSGGTGRADGNSEG